MKRMRLIVIRSKPVARQCTKGVKKHQGEGVFFRGRCLLMYEGIGYGKFSWENIFLRGHDMFPCPHVRSPWEGVLLSVPWLRS